MPIYEYDCPGCGQSLEVIQKISEPSLEVCPRCGGKSLKKLTSLNSFSLKGAGWYRDGYSNHQSDTVKPEAKPTTNSTSSAA